MAKRRIKDEGDPSEFSLAEPMFRLAVDASQAAAQLSRANARWLVDRYYEVQEDRKRAGNQARASSESGEPCRLIDWSFRSQRRYETALCSILGEFAAGYRVGAWMQSILGIGPVLSAGMLVNFNVANCPTVGKFWRFAGMDPTLIWLGKEKANALLRTVRNGNGQDLTAQGIAAIQQASGQHAQNIVRVYNEGYTRLKGGTVKGWAGLALWLARRPWNSRLKSFCLYKWGETQVKFCNHERSFYGPLYTAKKAQLIVENESGKFAPYAAEAVHRVARSTEAYKHYSAGRLPPAHIHNRARRWITKMFLSHLHEVMHMDYFGTPAPAPFIFEHPLDGGKHTHKIDPPGDMNAHDGLSLRQLK